MDPVDRFRSVVGGKDRQEYGDAARSLRHWMMANDPHYPIYHFVGPESWINDPNGPIYYQGRYHLFYQFDPILDGQRSARCWGHAISEDLVHWQDWPVALWPDTPYDRNGVFSGNTFVGDDGQLCALYTGNVDGRQETYGILAYSLDEGLTWHKKVVMDNDRRPNDHSPVHWDGYVWREGQTWQQLVGGATAGEHGQGAAWLWRSPDLEQWTLQGNIAPDLKFGDYWELPYLFPLDGKHVFMVGCDNPYWLGSYNGEQMLFRPDSLEPQSVDNGNYYSFNPNMTDDRGPGGAQRRLMHGWVTGPASPTASVPYWQGAHSIPRVIHVHGNRLWHEPVPEISSLRSEHLHLENVEMPGRLPLEGDAVELQVTFTAESNSLFGVKLRVSEDGSDYVRVFYDARTQEFGVDGPTIERNVVESDRLAQRRSIKLERQPSFLGTGSAVPMHIFLDRSIVEVYVNGCAYTARAFSPPGARGIEIFADDDATTVGSMDAWLMTSMWEDSRGDGK